MSNTTLHAPVTNQPLTDALAQALCNTPNVGVQIGSGFDGKMTYVNDTFLSMIGYTRSEFDAGKISWQDLTPTEFRSVDEQVVKNLTTHGASPAFTKQYLHKDGHPVNIYAHVLLIPGSKTDWMCYLVDLSNTK